MNLSQREIANILSVSKSNYARWESRENVISLKHLVAFCNISRLTLDYTLGLSKDKRKITETIQYDNKILGEKLKKLDYFII